MWRFLNSMIRDELADVLRLNYDKHWTQVLYKRICLSLVGDWEGFEIAALIVELCGGGGDLFVDEGVPRDGGSLSVDSGVMAGRELPDYGQAGRLYGVDDDLGDQLALLFSEEHDFFEEVLWVVTLDEGNDERGISFRVEVADGYAGALTLVGVLPELPIVCGEIEGREDLPVILLDG